MQISLKQCNKNNKLIRFLPILLNINSLKLKQASSSNI